MRFKTITKPTLFIVFFMAFLVVGVLPFLFTQAVMMNTVERQLRVPWDDTLYHLTTQTAHLIEQVCIQRWIDNLRQLSAALDETIWYEDVTRNPLLRIIFQNTEEIVALSLQLPNTAQPIYLLKEARLQQLTKDDPEGVASFFNVPALRPSENQDIPEIQPPIFLKGSQNIFLPIAVNFNWENGQQGQLYAIHDLTRGLRSLEPKLLLGNRQIYVLDPSGRIMYSNWLAYFLEGDVVKFPIMEQIRKSLATQTRIFKVEPFTYDHTRYVGNFSRKNA